MLTREATYEDYGFSEEEDKKFNEFCRKLEMRDKGFAYLKAVVNHGKFVN